MTLRIAIKRRSENRTRPSRWISFLASLALHFTAVAALLSIRVTLQPDLPDTKYQVVPLPTRQDNKLSWYDFRQPAPEIAPEHPFGPSSVPQGEKDTRTLIARSPAPKSLEQLVRQPDPAPLPDDIPAPNVISAPPKPAPKQFVPPALARTQTQIEAPQSLEAAPALYSPISVKQFGPELSVLKLPPRRFVAPATAKADDKSRSSTPLIASPAPLLGDSAAGIQAAIVGLKPTENFTAPLPEGSRTAQFARAPSAGAVSSGAAADNAPKLADVATRGTVTPPTAAAPPVMPPRDPRVVKETVFRNMNRTMLAPLRPSSRVIPPAIEAQFANRNVYTFVVPDVGLPEYSGDWVLWFAEDAPPVTQVARISAPVPVKKYAGADPASAFGDSNVSGKIQIAAKIDRNGKVSGARVLQVAIPEAMRQRVAEELQTWEFAPTLRNGEAESVDVVVELPYHPVARIQQASHE